MSKFYNGIVENLKNESNLLNDKLKKYRENNDMNGYVSTLRSLKDTLNLISNYDWKLMYSEYGVEKYNRELLEKELREILDKIDISRVVKPIAVLDELYKQRDDIKDKIENNYLITEIAVWEQNHEGQIRNRKVWTIDIPYKEGISIKNKNGSFNINPNGTVEIKNFDFSINKK